MMTCAADTVGVGVLMLLPEFDAVCRLQAVVKLIWMLICGNWCVTYIYITYQ